MKKFLKGLAWVVGILAVIILVLRLTMFKLWTIPEDQVLDGSMRPSLRSGDVVLVMTVGKRSFGQLVRCADPEDPQRWVVGRIVGMEGDTVEVEGPSVTVNGTRYNTSDACKDPIKVPHPTSGSEIAAQCSRVEMGGGWHFRAYVPGVESKSTHKVGAGRLFLLSDNRSFHDDSRDFGTVPAETCNDLIVFRLWGKAGTGDTDSRFMYIR
ncbi:MAG: signal peptidase I [Polyangiaceae bacterium]